jgi:hypothetical protein
MSEHESIAITTASEDGEGAPASEHSAAAGEVVASEDGEGAPASVQAVRVFDDIESVPFLFVVRCKGGLLVGRGGCGMVFIPAARLVTTRDGKQTIGF